MRLSAIWQLCASWFAGDTTVDATPLRSITGLLVSKGAVVHVYDEDIHGAFDEMYKYAGERMYDMVRELDVTKDGALPPHERRDSDA